MKSKTESIDPKELIDWLTHMKAIVGQARDDEFALGNSLGANYLKGEAEAYSSMLIAIKNGQLVK